jgi:hypothetical protein
VTLPDAHQLSAPWQVAAEAQRGHAECPMYTEPLFSGDPTIRMQVTGAVGWRREGIKYKKNEVIRQEWDTVWAAFTRRTCRSALHKLTQ